MADPRVARRAGFFAGMAAELIAVIPDISRSAYFAPNAPMVCAGAYFRISDVYRGRRNRPDSLTDDIKKATLHAMAIMAVRPFVPLNRDVNEPVMATLANPLFALACANAWIDGRNLFEQYPFDYLKRFYMSLLMLRFPSLDAYLAYVNGDSDDEPPVIDDLDPTEIRQIDDWTQKLHLLSTRNINRDDS